MGQMTQLTEAYSSVALVMALCALNHCGWVIMPRHNSQSGISDTRFSAKLWGTKKAPNNSNLIEPKLFLIGDWCKACIDQKRVWGCWFFI